MKKIIIEWLMVTVKTSKQNDMKIKGILLSLLATITLGITSCTIEGGSSLSSDRKTEPLYLRQLVKSNKVETSSGGSFFLIAGSYSSDTKEKPVVQVMANVEGEYRFLEMEMKKIRIRIDSTCKVPYIILNYYDTEECSISQLLRHSDWYVNSYTVVCSEELLPEKLLPIEL